MLDWNHNGESDAFDAAVDMMLLDEMDRTFCNLICDLIYRDEKEKQKQEETL